MAESSRLVIVGGLAGPGQLAGGVWSVATEHYNVLRSAGYRVQLIGGWLGKVPERHPANIVRLRRPFPGAGLRGLYGVRARTVLRALIDESDVVHIHLSRDYLTTTALRIALAKKKTVVVQPHGMLAPPSSLATAAFDLIFAGPYRHPNLRWLALTDVEVRNLVALGIARENIGMISNAVVSTAVEASNVPRKGKHFSFISRLHERKQPDVFIAAAMEVLKKHPDSTFLIAGPDAGMRPQILELTRLNRKSFEVRDALNREQVLSELAKSSALVLPSIGEVAPMIVLEAISTGTPSIITNDCGFADVLAARNAAFVVPPNAKEVASAMLDVIEKSSDARGMAERALRVSNDYWSPEAMLDALERTYEERRHA